MTKRIDWNKEKKQQSARRVGVNTGGIQTWSQPDVIDERSDRTSDPTSVDVLLHAGAGDDTRRVWYSIPFKAGRSVARYISLAAAKLHIEFNGRYGFTPGKPRLRN